MTTFDFTRTNVSSRHWMGVVYNPLDITKHHGMGGFLDFADCLSECLEDIVGKEIKYYCHGSEVCPTTGTPHLQLYFIFKEKNTLESLRKKFSKWLGFANTIAFKVADANVQGCVDYCLKDKSNLVECGQLPAGKGKRSDIDMVVDCIRNGGDINTVANKHPAAFIKMGTGISKWIAQTSVPRDFKTEVFWLHGPTGSGKSRWAMNSVDRSNVYLKSGSNKWWCNYAGQKNILWDDFRPSKDVPFEFLLRLLDRFPMSVEGKGTAMNFAPERIFITTPKNPLETFRHWEFLGEENMQQLVRRVTHVIEFAETTKFFAPSFPAEFVLVPNIWEKRAMNGIDNIEETSDTSLSQETHSKKTSNQKKKTKICTKPTKCIFSMTHSL